MSRIMIQRQLTRIILGIAVITIGLTLPACGSEKFESLAWKEAQERSGKPYVRLEMADDLIASQSLLSKTKDEVIALLGEPEKSGYFKEYDLVYWLGPERNSFISIDSEWLVIKLDERGRVKDYLLKRD